MGEYHQSGTRCGTSSTTWWITKYRYKVLRGEVAERARDLLRQISAAREVRYGEPGVAPVYAVDPSLSPNGPSISKDPCGPIVLVRFTPSLGPPPMRNIGLCAEAVRAARMSIGRVRHLVVMRPSHPST